MVCGKIRKTDEERIKKAIKILKYSENIDALTLVKQIYVIAFSAVMKMSGSAADVLCRLYFGEESDEKKYLKKIEIVDFLPSEMQIGDMLFYGNKDEAEVAFYDGKGFLLFRNGVDGYKEKLSEEVLIDFDSASLRAAFRPISDMILDDSGYTEISDASPAVIALLATAESYILRGYRCQYDDSRFTRVGGGEFRWQIGLKEAEDYTSERWGYVNCAAFTYELYRTALGLDLGSRYTTYELMRHYAENDFKYGEPVYPFCYKLTHVETEKEKESLKCELKRRLRIGDLIVYRRSNGNGHVIMYIGGGVVVHSTGLSYNYSESRETYEPTVRYMDLSDSLFNPASIRYLFSENIVSVGIVRPLDEFFGEIPQNTRYSVKNMRGVLAEKLSSVGAGQTVNTGDLITYTFKIYNTENNSVTLGISDEICEFEEYISGAGEFSQSKFTSQITVPRGEVVAISYTVKVIGKPGSVISGKGALIGGVKHNCPDIRVEKTLTKEEKVRIVEAASRAVRDLQGISELEAVNAIYGAAKLGIPFDCTDKESFERELLVGEEFYILREDGKYRSMIAPELYGGRNLQTQNLYCATSKICSGRVRLPRVSDLVAGDVIFARYMNEYRVYLYTGADRLLNLSSPSKDLDSLCVRERLERLISCYHYFAVLRPSIKKQKFS